MENLESMLASIVSTLTICGFVFRIWSDVLIERLERRLNGRYVSRDQRDSDVRLLEEKIRLLEKHFEATLGGLDKRLERMENAIEEIRAAIIQQGGHQQR